MQLCPFLLTNCPKFSPALADSMETREGWVVAGPIVGSLVFIFIVLGGAILLRRRRKTRQDKRQEKTEMNSNWTSQTTVTEIL